MLAAIVSMTTMTGVIVAPTAAADTPTAPANKTAGKATVEKGANSKPASPPKKEEEKCADDTCAVAPKTLDFDGKNYDLVWKDDFNGDSFDPAWGTTPVVENSNAHYRNKVDPKDGDFRFKGGYLSVHLNPPKPGETIAKNKTVNSGGISTNGKKAWKYGVFQARIRFHSEPKLWPALWLMPASRAYGWPYDGENDWVENYPLPAANPVVYSTVHYSDSLCTTRGLGNASSTAYAKPVRELYNQWHTFTMEWTDKGFTYFLDGKKVGYIDASYKYPDAASRQKCNNQGKDLSWPSNRKVTDLASGKSFIVDKPHAISPFDQKYYLILDLASYVKQNEISKLNLDQSKFDLDYVRVYQTKKQQAEQKDVYLRYALDDQAVNPDGSVIHIPDQNRTVGEKIGDLPVLRNKIGQASFSWYRVEARKPWAKVNKDTVQKDDLTLFPKWENAAWVTVHNADGSASQHIAVPAGGKFAIDSLPAGVAPAGKKTFKGWYLDKGLSKPAAAAMTLNKDIDLYPKWAGDSDINKPGPGSSNDKTPGDMSHNPGADKAGSSSSSDSSSSVAGTILAVAALIAAIRALVPPAPGASVDPVRDWIRSMIAAIRR